MKIGFLPIDNRPVCYTLPEIIAGMDEDIEMFLPERKFLGDLKKSADVDAIFNWLENLPQDLDAIVLSLDTIAYGGLIPSRRGVETLEQIKNRIQNLKNILYSKKCKVYAFSSIMRISNNNYNEEEKEYWTQYGKKIFEYSYNLHKSGKEPQNNIPPDNLKDYLQTRKRNFEINKIYLKWQKEGLFEWLIFSKDDCAQYGLNVMEADELYKMGAVVKTGADEIPLSLLARAIKGVVKICPIFLEPGCKDLISNYEDISVEQTVTGQILLSGCEISQEKDADILLFVNNFKDKQGEIVMKIDTEMFSSDFKVPQRPYMVADLRFANGADNGFIEALFRNNLYSGDFYGYSAWNTSANSLGSLICASKVRFLAKKYNKKAFERLQVTRFLDDWAYQANVRQSLAKPDMEQLTQNMKYYERIVEKVLKTEVDVQYNYPWDRLFEVEIEFN